VDLEKEVEELREIAEGHAFSVRQLIGQRARLYHMLNAVGGIGHFPDGTSLGPTLRAVETTESQFYQDIYCLLVNQGKRNGYFIEFGACDGVLLSNTLLLEREFGWTGILSEPMPSWHAALEKNRRCIIDKRCIWTETGSTIDFAEYEGDEYHTESSAFEEGGARRASNVFKVPTVTLADLLREHDAPNTIDFMSMDVEGGEHAILSTFPFDEYRFNFMCVEQHGEHAARINQLLTENGYRQVFAEASGHDGYYVPADAS